MGTEVIKGGGIDGELLLNSYSLGVMRKFWKWTVVMVEQYCASVNDTESCTYNNENGKLNHEYFTVKEIHFEASRG